MPALGGGGGGKRGGGGDGGLEGMADVHVHVQSESDGRRLQRREEACGRTAPLRTLASEGEMGTRL